MKHTQGKLWIDDNGFIAAGTGDEYMTFADLDCSDRDIDERESNKKELVKRWNLHEELLAKLQAILSWNDYAAEDMGEHEKEVFDAAKELLKNIQE